MAQNISKNTIAILLMAVIIISLVGTIASLTTAKTVIVAPETPDNAKGIVSVKVVDTDEPQDTESGTVALEILPKS